MPHTTDDQPTSEGRALPLPPHQGAGRLPNPEPPVFLSTLRRRELGAADIFDYLMLLEDLADVA